MKQTAAVELAGGKSLTFETGHLAKQAHGSCVARAGDNVVLGTACANPEAREGIDFFPLTVDYREYTYAGGRFPGGFIKREGRPTDKEVLTSRQIDRPIRPLFPEGFQCETQVIAFVLSADAENDPDVLAINAASAALAISDIPFLGPIGAVRVGVIEGRMVINPTYAEQRDSLLNIMVVGTENGIVMIESGAKGVSEETVVEAIDFAHTEIKKICAVIKELAAKVGNQKREVTPPEWDENYYNELKAKLGAQLTDALNTEKYQKAESYAKVKEIKAQFKEQIPEDDDEARARFSRYFEALRERIFREQVIEQRRRPDGRAFDQIRNISCEVAVLPRTHGSAIFTRGETQALVTTTLGTGEDTQRMEGFEGEREKRFMLHYNFPPFSVGEVKFLRGAGRREIGHGALAERALTAVLPTEEAWPYTTRVVSDILESNGSSSMASVCGATMAMLDAGVPLTAPVAGMAMGLVKEGEKYSILSDIAGAEDHYGDMDFKVAGTRDGITALQMDIKVAGITSAIMREALEQARRGRLHILEKMNEAISAPKQISQYAPRFYTVTIPVDKIRELIGPGGKVVRGITEATGVKIDIEDSGLVKVASSDEASAQRALQMIGDITATAEVGKTYLGKVVRLAEFGAFVEIFPGTDGLLHISEVAEHRIGDIRDELKEGDQILVKVLSVEGNRIRLSRKAVLKEQRAKMGGGEGGDGGEGGGESHGGGGRHGGREQEMQPRGGSMTIEGGGNFEDAEDNEPNFNREGVPHHAAPGGGGRPGGGFGGDRGGRGGRGGRGRGRGGRGRGPGGGGGGRGGFGGGDRGNR
ncbi:MAG TPA: polyribonucleotide nucleotidyltransferase [Terriglobales bacterium]|nr:polyribonucleotide nucleotidyltransferase [Terriglobales bacterium]